MIAFFDVDKKLTTSLKHAINRCFAKVYSFKIRACMLTNLLTGKNYYAVGLLYAGVNFAVAVSVSGNYYYSTFLSTCMPCLKLRRIFHLLFWCDSYHVTRLPV